MGVLIGLQDGRTMFVGLYRVGQPALIETDAWSRFLGVTVPGGTDDHYPLALSDHLAEYVEHLFIDWGGGSSGKRAWCQRTDLQDKRIVELHADAITRLFPGLMQLVAPLSIIAEAPVTWIDALSAARGVYLLTCPRTGEAYVGSATGTGGFWGRWSAYHADGHGGNVALVARERSDYRASILQVAGSTETADDILAVEALWKRKLETIGTGLNRN